MGIQSVTDKNLDSVKKENISDIKDASEKYMYFKRFALGCNYDKDRFVFDNMLYDILNSNNCDIEELLESTIKGDILKLNNKTLSSASQYSVSFEDLYNRWLNQGNTGDFDVFLNVIINGGVVLEKSGW